MIQVYPDTQALSLAVADWILQEATRAADARKRFSLVLSGGHTPRQTYQLLADSPYRGKMPWAQTHVFWGDERCVPPDDARSNERMAREAFLDTVPIPAGQVHPMRCATTPAEAAAAYEALLRAFFSERAPRFDVILLGLGEDGHTASLFPYNPVLEERKRWVAEVYVPEQKMHRLTLTVPLINQAAAVAFLVTGPEKADVLRQTLQGPYDPRRLPAQQICPTDGKLYWFVDEQACSSTR